MEHFLQTCTADHFKMCALKLITCYVAFACLPCFLKPFFKTDFKRFPERNNFRKKNSLERGKQTRPLTVGYFRTQPFPHHATLLQIDLFAALNE